MAALRIIVAAVVLDLFAATAGAPVQMWSNAEIKRVSAEIAAGAEAKGIEGKTLGTYGNNSAAIWRRARSGEAELHKTKADLIVVEEGEATLISGGTMPNARTTAPNELRAASISGGETRKLGPGDIIRIPPGTPHQFVLAPGQSVAYFVFKIGQ